MNTKAKKTHLNRSLRKQDHATVVAVSSFRGIMVLCLGGLLAGCGDQSAPTDPCAACQPDQLCVQINDSSTQCKSPVPTVLCKTVSAECRAAITADKSCKGTSSACAAELCFAPYQCINNAPCGNETPNADLYCYGP